jgi:hypothetical protein
MTRLEANLALLEHLRAYLLACPDLRFGQALVNLDVLKLKRYGDDLVAEDPYYEEPQSMLYRVKANLAQLNLD